MTSFSVFHSVKLSAAQPLVHQLKAFHKHCYVIYPHDRHPWHSNTYNTSFLWKVLSKEVEINLQNVSTLYIIFPFKTKGLKEKNVSYKNVTNVKTHIQAVKEIPLLWQPMNHCYYEQYCSYPLWMDAHSKALDFPSIQGAIKWNSKQSTLLKFGVREIILAVRYTHWGQVGDRGRLTALKALSSDAACNFFWV